MNASITSHLVNSLLPPEIAAFIQEHLLHPRSPFQIYSKQAWTYLRHLQAFVAPVLNRLLSQSGLDVSGVNISGIVATAVVVLTFLAVVNYVRRMIMWWTRFAFKVVFWAALVGLGAWVYEHGVVESVEDAFALGGKVIGYAAGVKDVWMSEYERYEQQQQQYPMAGGRGRSSGR